MASNSNRLLVYVCHDYQILPLFWLIWFMIGFTGSAVLLSYDRLLRLWQASQVLNHLRNNRLQRLSHSYGLHRQVSQVLSLFWFIWGVTGPKVMLFFCLIFGIAGCKGQFFLLVCVLAGFTGYVPLRSHLIYYQLHRLNFFYVWFKTGQTSQVMLILCKIWGIRTVASFMSAVILRSDFRSVRRHR